MIEKCETIKAYFEGWQEDLDRVKRLMADNKYYLEAILVLSCYIGALGSLRYPGVKEDNKVYKRVVREYSGKKEFYEQVDLLFFLQWPRSLFQSHGDYQKLKNHEEISKVIVDAYGNEVQIMNGTRYISQQDFLTCIEQRPFQALTDAISGNIYHASRFVKCSIVICVVVQFTMFVFPLSINLIRLVVAPATRIIMQSLELFCLKQPKTF